MKATKEQIIKMGCQIITDVLKDKYLENSIVVEERKVKIFPDNSGIYYEHEGWFFKILSVQNLGEYNDAYLMRFLDDGKPIDLFIAHGDDSSSTGKYIVKSSNGKYIRVSEEDFFKHHNFDFTKKEFEKKKF